MKSLNEYINSQQEISESLADMWTIAGGLAIYDLLKIATGLGVIGIGTAILKYWQHQEKSRDSKQKDLIVNVLSFAKGNNKCPNYNEFVNAVEQNKDEDLSDVKVTSIIKELINVVETDEQKKGLKELIKLQVKELRAIRNKYGIEAFDKPDRDLANELENLSKTI